MRFNGRADYVAGGGGLQGSVNGVLYPFPTYGGGCWLTDTLILLQLQIPAPGTLATYNPTTQVLTPLEPHAMANDFAASGGRYIGWLSGYGCFGSLGPNPVAGTAGPHAVSADGTIAYIPNRGVGYGLTVTDARGQSVMAPPSTVPVDVQTLGAGVAIWKDGAIGRPPTRPAVTDASGLILAHYAGLDWLLYWSPTLGVVLQPDGETDGYVLVPPGGLAFSRDLVASTDGQLWVGWSTSQGEAPADIVRFPVDLSKPLVPLVPTPPIPPIPPKPPLNTGDLMALDSKTLILYKAVKPSSKAGCVNFILHDETVASCQKADGSLQSRPAGTDGPWEQFQQTGSLATVNCFDTYYAFGVAPLDKVL